MSYKNVWPLKRQILIWIFRLNTDMVQNFDIKDGYGVYKLRPSVGNLKIYIHVQ